MRTDLHIIGIMLLIFETLYVSHVQQHGCYAFWQELSPVVSCLILGIPFAILWVAAILNLKTGDSNA